jgi:hypothetical protein
MFVQIHLDYPGRGEDPAGTFVKAHETAAWTRMPTIGEAMTVHGLTLGIVTNVIWPLVDQDDVVLELEIAEKNEDLRPTRAQLEDMGWRYAMPTRNRDDNADRRARSWSSPGRS